MDAANRSSSQFVITPSLNRDRSRASAVRAVRERGPVDDRAAERRELLVGRREAEVVADPAQAPGEHVRVAQVRAGLEPRLVAREPFQQLSSAAPALRDRRSAASSPVSQSISVP